MFAGVAAAASVIPVLDEGELVVQEIGAFGEAVEAAEAIAPSSRVLQGAALEDAGFVRGVGEAAHHIVLQAALKPQLQRERCSHASGSASTMPQTECSCRATWRLRTRLELAVHSTIHTTEYYSTVNELLQGAVTREQVIERLGVIRSGLLGGGLVKRVYKPSVAEGWEWVLPEYEADNLTIVEAFGKPTGSTWRPIRMKVLRQDEDGRPWSEADMPWLGTHALILRPRAVAVLRDLCLQAGRAVATRPARTRS